MIIKTLPEGATNLIEYEVDGNVLDFGDGELTIKLNKKERDDPVHLDICFDYTGGLIMGAGKDAQKYVAQVDIPARRYDEAEDEEGGTNLSPVPFDIDRCTLTLWEIAE